MATNAKVIKARGSVGSTVLWSEALEGAHKVLEEKQEERTGKSYFLFTRDNWLRKKCTAVTENAWFDRFVLVLILVNCSLLAINDPVCEIWLEDKTILDFYPRHDCNGYQQQRATLNDMEYFFSAAFMLEMILKTIAMGMVMGKHSYLRDPWNIIDFVVVVLSFIALLPSVGNFSAIRTVRVLKPLRTMKRVPGMRAIVLALLRSLKPLVSVVFVCFFIFFLFGVLGLDLFVGVLRSRCFRVIDSETTVLVDPTILCSTNDHGGLKCSDMFGPDTFCATSNNATGEVNPNPIPDVSFDDIFSAFLLIFQCVSMEGWVDLMYMYEDAYNRWASRLFFISLICIGAFYSINLALAVITHKFTASSEEAAQEKATSEEPGESSYIGKLLLRAQAYFEEISAARQFRPDDPSPFIRFRATMNRLVNRGSFQVFIILCILVNSLCLAIEYHSQTWFEDSICKAATGGECTGPLFEYPSYDYTEDNPPPPNLTVVPMVLVGCVNKATGLACLPDPSMWQGKTLQDVCNGGCKGMPETVNEVLEYLNLSFTIIFGLEVVLKLLGLGTWRYLKVKSNLFDVFVVLASLAELAASNAGGSAISGLRAFRLFRVFKLARSWTSLRMIVRTITISLTSLGPLIVIMFIVQYIAALLGMEFFGGYFLDRDTGYRPRSNFDSFLPNDTGHGALLTVFQIITGENWNAVMYDAIRSREWPSSLFFVALVIVGNYMLFNLFLAILLHSFWTVHTQMKQQGESILETPLHAKQLQWALSTVRVAPLRAISSNNLRRVSDPASPGVSSPLGLGPPLEERRGSVSSMDDAIVEGGNLSEMLHSDHWLFNRRCNLMIFGPEGGLTVLHAVQRATLKLVEHRFFDGFVMVAILVSAVVLVLEHPMDSVECEACISLSCSICMQYRATELINYLLIGLFTMEMALKVVAHGLLFHPESYLRDAWNVLDFGTVMVSLASVFLSSSLRTLRSIRALRALRPLRMLKRNKGMKVAVICIFKSIPPALNVGLVCFLLFSIFAILGVQFFAGKFYQCLTGHELTLAPLNRDPTTGAKVVDIITCAAAGGTWRPSHSNFDGYPLALVTVFEMATTEGWLQVLGDAVNAVGLGLQPIEEHNPGGPTFFLACLMAAAMFVLSLYVGVVIDSYNKTKIDVEGVVVLSKAQREWVVSQKIALLSEPRKPLREPTNAVSRMLFRVINMQWFEVAVTVLILLNMFNMASSHFGNPTDWAETVRWANLAFTATFLAEAAVKIIALGPHIYLTSNPWNVFDVVVVMVSVAGIVIDFVTGGSVNVPAVTVLRALRVLRLFRLVKRMKRLRQLMEALFHSLPALVNVGSLMLLFFVIYSTMGVAFFYNVRWAQDPDNWVNRHANFDRFHMAMATLFRIITGEGWHGIMHYCAESNPYLSCQDYRFLGSGCGDATTSYMFFISFKLFGAFIMLNLFIAFILDSFEHAVQERHQIIPKDTLLSFPVLWQELDTEATQVLCVSQLPTLLKSIESPLGLKGKHITGSAMVQLIRCLQIPSYEGKVHYMDVYLRLLGRVLSVQIPEEHYVNNLRRTTLHERLEKAFGPRYTEMADSDGDASCDHAARILQRLARDRTRMQVARRSSIQAGTVHAIIR